MVLFALFTSLVSEEEKQNMVQKLLSLEKPMSIKFGTPKFPEKVGVDTLCFVTAESCWLFDCSKNDPEFLSLSVEEWKTDDQYRAVCQDAEMYQPWRGQGHSQQGM